MADQLYRPTPLLADLGNSQKWHDMIALHTRSHRARRFPGLPDDRDASSCLHVDWRSHAHNRYAGTIAGGFQTKPVKHAMPTGSPARLHMAQQAIEMHLMQSDPQLM